MGMDITLALTIAVFTICMLTIWIKSLLDIAMALLLAPRFGLCCKFFSLFGLQFKKTDGRWEHSFERLSPLCEHHVTVDVSQTQEGHVLREQQFARLRYIVKAAVGVLVTVLVWPSVSAIFAGNAGYLDVFLASIGAGLLLHALMAMGIYIYVHYFSMKRLGGYVDQLTRRLRAGDSFASMQLVPVEQLPYKSPTAIEKLLYYNYYLNYLLETGQTAALAAPTHALTEIMRGRTYTIQETYSYYWLIFYYSRYELDPALAKMFLHRCWPTISTDKDANAKRVLAYFAFGIEHDRDKAWTLLNEARAVVGSYSLGAERALEIRLLDELEGFLRAPVAADDAK